MLSQSQKLPSFDVKCKISQYTKRSTHLLKYILKLLYKYICIYTYILYNSKNSKNICLEYFIQEHLYTCTVAEK